MGRVWCVMCECVIYPSQRLLADSSKCCLLNCKEDLSKRIQCRCTGSALSWNHLQSAKFTLGTMNKRMVKRILLYFATTTLFDNENLSTKYLYVYLNVYYIVIAVVIDFAFDIEIIIIFISIDVMCTRILNIQLICKILTNY